MIVYKYDIQTKEFIQELEINEAYGINLPFTTTIKPLAKKDGFAICFNGTKWECIEDNRNTVVYNKETKQESRIDYLGKIKDDVTTLKPEQFDKWDYKTNKWVCDEALKNEFRIQQIDNKVESIITKPYPIYKQLNIRGLLNPYTIHDIEVMDMFIDSVRSIGKEAKSTGKTVDEINWGGLDEYTSHDEISKDTIIQIREKLGL